MICALADEVIQSVFRVLGGPSAFTGELTVRLLGPAAVGETLRLRARQTGTDGRKRFLEAEIAGNEGPVASAKAICFDVPTPNATDG